jgi:tetratricopeptide (TPR) repeat protein
MPGYINTYKKKPKKTLPDTLAEMEPLFAAVKHGCLAGLHQASLDDVYYSRVNRTDEVYTVRKFGALGANLSCLANFFTQLWDKPAANLTESDKGLVLNLAGFTLRAVGRLRDATQSTKASLTAAELSESWKNAASAAGNLSELYLTLGEVALAVKYGKKSVTFSDISEDGFQKEAMRTTYADALHQSGDNQAAEKRFIKAEIMQQKSQPQVNYLYGLVGFQYCDLLLSMGQYQVVLERAKVTLKLMEQQGRLLDIALDKRSIGKALIAQSLANSTADLTEAKNYLHQTVEGLRAAGTQDHTPRGLLARANLYQQQKVWSKCWLDLDEVLEIASDGKMKLFLVDYHLAACAVIKAQLDDGVLINNAFAISENGEELKLSAADMRIHFRKHLAAAGDLVIETGYHRQDDEVAALSKVILG